LLFRRDSGRSFDRAFVARCVVARIDGEGASAPTRRVRTKDRATTSARAA
jgi:hypothetical protein